MNTTPELPSSKRSIRRLIAVALAFVAILAGSGIAAVLPARPAAAFKPTTHANACLDALADLSADSAVAIHGITVAADPEIAASVKAHPGAFKAGCVGPDAFPDIVAGQSVIHPGVEGRSVSDDWLRLLWDHAHRMPHGEDRQKAIAFTVGFLAHGAGDVWAHTLVNQFSHGVFPDITELSEHGDVAIRHIAVEKFVDRHRPKADLGDIWDGIDPPGTFVRDALIMSPEARQLGLPDHLLYFLDLRAELVAEIAALDAEYDATVVSVFDPASIAHAATLLAEIEYKDSWITDIDDGLAEWTDIGVSLTRYGMGENVDFGRLEQELREFLLTTVLSMLGAPDAAGYVLEAVAHCLDDIVSVGSPPEMVQIVSCARLPQAVKDALATVLKPLADLLHQYKVEAINALLHYYVDLDEVSPAVRELVDENGDGLLSYTEVQRLTDTDKLLDAPVLFPESTKGELSRLLHIGTDGSFDTESFAAYSNAVDSTKMLFLGRSGLNQFTTALGVKGVVYPKGQPQSDNSGLGWIKSFDGDHQWRKTLLPWWHQLFDGVGDLPREILELYTDGLDAKVHESAGLGTFPLWNDCQARDKVFRKVFREVLPGAFDDALDDCIDLAVPENVDPTDPRADRVSIRVTGQDYALDGAAPGTSYEIKRNWRGKVTAVRGSADFVSAAGYGTATVSVDVSDSWCGFNGSITVSDPNGGFDSWTSIFCNSVQDLGSTVQSSSYGAGFPPYTITWAVTDSPVK